jgi:predicted alpha/beta-fold hydrolase
LPFVRLRLNTPDDDFIDMDVLHGGYRKVAVLCHGLEGSSQSQYIQGTAGLLHANGFDIAAMNYRGCSGEANRQVRSYHSGATNDLQLVIHSVLPSYDEIYLIGFSLGGNLVLKYSCDLVYPLHDKIKRVVSVSVPIDLKGASKELLKFKNKLYAYNFLQTLKAKTKQKHRQFPDKINIDLLERVKTVWDFDEYFTSRLHDFDGAEDYYDKCNSKQFLFNCQLPTLIINAEDDPFLSKSCFPIELATRHEHLHLLMPRYGGHVGFVHYRAEHYWNEWEILHFLGG